MFLVAPFPSSHFAAFLSLSLAPPSSSPIMYRSDSVLTIGFQQCRPHYCRLGCPPRGSSVQHSARRLPAQAAVFDWWFRFHIHLWLLRRQLEGRNGGSRSRGLCQGGTQGGDQVGWLLGRCHQDGGVDGEGRRQAFVFAGFGLQGEAPVMGSRRMGWLGSWK